MAVALIREMVSRRTAYSPTLSIHHTIAFARDPDAFREAAAASNPPALILKEWEGLAKQPFDTAPFKKAWLNMQQFVKRFYDAGGMRKSGDKDLSRRIVPDQGRGNVVERNRAAAAAEALADC